MTLPASKVVSDQFIIIYKLYNIALVVLFLWLKSEADAGNGSKGKEFKDRFSELTMSYLQMVP